MKQLRTRLHPCEVDTCLELISGKWKSLILWKLSRQPYLHFGELRRALPEVTQKMLTQQLRALERDQLITRTVITPKPVRVRYELSAFGETLRPVLAATAQWGQRHRQRITTILQSQEADR